MEEAFQRRKRRELEQARMAGAGDRETVQRVVRGSAKSAATILALRQRKEIQEVLRRELLSSAFLTVESRSTYKPSPQYYSAARLQE